MGERGLPVETRSPLFHSAISNPQSCSVDYSAPPVASSHHPIVPVGRVEAGGARAVHGGRAAVVHQQRQLEIAVLLVDQCAEVAEPDAKVRLAIVQLLLRDALLEEAGGRRHELREANGTHGTRRLFIELTLYANQTEREIRLQALS